MFAGNFAPVGWQFCDGSLLAISEYDVLFQLIGTTYGGDGIDTFALPDLRGRVPIHTGSGFAEGQNGGTEQVTLTVNQIPSHSHVPRASAARGNQASPGGNVWAASSRYEYSAAAPSLTMPTNAIGSEGGSQPHDNMIPFVAISFIISLFGIYPPQT